MNKTHLIKRKMSSEDARSRIGDSVVEGEANCTEAGIYLDESTGDPVFIYLPMPRMVSELRRAVMDLKMSQTIRATGVTNMSKTFGMAPRAPVRRREACAATNMSVEQPESHRVLVDLASVFTDMLRDLLPDVAKHDHAIVEQVRPEWRMADDVLWTSGVVNRSSVLPYHLDRANFATWSAMPVIRRHMRGGYLHLPEYDLMCGCRDGWVTFFLGQALVHGVSPMYPVKPDAYRYSAVYYAMKGMRNCFDVATEQARALAVRSGREDHMADDSINVSDESG